MEVELSKHYFLVYCVVFICSADRNIACSYCALVLHVVSFLPSFLSLSTFSVSFLNSSQTVSNFWQIAPKAEAV